MGYLLRWVRLSSYFAAALGLILLISSTIYETYAGGAVSFYGFRILIISLVGIAGTEWIKEYYLEGTDKEEYYALLPTPQVKTPKFPLITGKEILLGGVAGALGVLVSSCGAAIALDWGSIDSGAGYFFWILTCLGYPLVGALLGGVTGYYAFFFLSRYVDADISHIAGNITRLFVGFVVGLLTGIAPYILLGAWGG